MKVFYLLILYLHRLFVLSKKAIYKTRNTGTGNGMWGMQETQGMFTRFSGNLLEDSGECSHFSIPGNAREDSGECSRRFRGMLSKILGNVQEDSGECSERFRGMFRKIPGNAFNFKLIKATFYLKKQMLSYSRRRDLSLLYLMKQ